MSEELPEDLESHVQELGPADWVEYLSREIAERARQVLRDAVDDDGRSVLARGNDILSFGPNDPATQTLLTEVRAKVEQGRKPPLIPLSQSALVTNDQGLNHHAVLRSELLSADRVDMICPFIGNQGLNLVIDLLREFGPRLRLVTTTYLGGTHAQALERLARFGAQIKVVYERPDQKTSLHAKAWIFYRDTGFTTAVIGSSNLSPRALVDGLEWNVRLGSRDAPQVLRELEITFERLWGDPRYERFDPDRDGERLRAELDANFRSDNDQPRFFADLHPLPHQQEALDALRYARLEGRSKNLIVAATGTGKTLLAAFDYERWAREVGGRPSLLYIAHREDILSQSLGAFRAVLRDGDFGELHVGGARADSWRHVFASVQALAKRELNEIHPERFEYVVVDEFHHAEAPTYSRLLGHFKPKQLVGLTATPERADGRREIIDDLWPPTYELRLWHALDRRLLCPFHYFGIDDGTDLTDVRWSGGRYEESSLEEALIRFGEDRVRTIVRELRERVVLDGLRAVAFRVSKRHADFMAERLTANGFPAKSLHSGSVRDERRATMKSFRRGEIPILCTVDLLSEGVDVPEINTVLFLRPTESATVFVQQLGRGLRNHREKGALTVLDFVGQQNRRFRMDLRFRAMTGLSRVDLEKAVKEGFPCLPPGCDIRLDRVTRERVLRNLKEAVPTDIRQLAAEARRFAERGESITVGRFLEETGMEVDDLYRSNRSLLQIRHAAGMYPAELPEGHARASRIIHANDRARLNRYLAVVRERSTSGDYGRMLAYPLTDGFSLDGVHPDVLEEVEQLIEHLLRSAKPLPRIAADLPFSLHGLYNRDEIVLPFRDNPLSMRQGTFYVEARGLDIHLVTLRKSERHFSPTTRYQDYFEGPDLLHWESQSTTTLNSPTGRRLIEGAGRHLFFVREHREDPFVCLGFARPISHESEKPIRLRWRLEHAVPDQIYVRFEQAAG